MKEQPKRRPGRPRTGRKARIDASISQEVSTFLDWYGSDGGNVSAFIERLIKASPDYQSWHASLK